ncbi:hypothetical protein LCGC14_0413760 [marine sediment metagenome]|uniref:HAD family hydrolase n=1 Tax=marine sediment metagenome TaxID=412755 RepID=A0A0F9SYY4_9ZZZZ
MIKAILYDLDGVLVEAREWHYVSLNRALEEIAGTTINREEHEGDFNGLPTRRKLAKLVSLGRVKSEDRDRIWSKKQDLTKDTIRELGKYDKVKERLHHFTANSGFVSVCVTNSITETAELMLKYTGQLDYMKFFISNQMVTHPKPSSEPYIVAMVRLGLEPSECIIVEDSEVGMQSAVPTGAPIWGVNNCADVTEESFMEFMKNRAK